MFTSYSVFYQYLLVYVHSTHMFVFLDLLQCNKQKPAERKSRHVQMLGQTRKDIMSMYNDYDLFVWYNMYQTQLICKNQYLCCRHTQKYYKIKFRNPLSIYSFNKSKEIVSTR